MAVEKMKFVNIAGPIGDMDDFVINTIVPFDIQLENAMYILDSVKGLFPFSEENPYERLNQNVADLIKVLGRDISYDPDKCCGLMPVNLLEPEIDGYERQLETIQKISRSLKEDLGHKKEIRKQLLPMQNLDVNIDKMFKFKYMKFRFGKMPKDSYKKLNTYIKELDTIAYEVSQERDVVYLVYFTPRSQQGNIDSLFASLFFERIRISGEVKGTPADALVKLNEEIDELESRINMLDKDAREFVERNFDRLQELYNFTIQLNEVFEVRRFAVRSRDAFYLTGWIPESQVNDFQAMVDRLKSVTCIVEDDDSVKKTTPPTRLKNIKFFRPFEELVRMYGTPSYNELDPTPLVAITYIIFFGIMFGDLGQGLVIALLSYFYYKKSGVEVAKIGISLGIVSMITGFFYGSLFADEHLLREWFPQVPMINSMESKMEILLVSVGFGAFLLIVAMILNIINKLKQEKLGKLLFDRNGLAGLVFYLALIYVILSVVLERGVSTVLVIIFVVAPFFVMMFAHPLENLIERKQHIFPKEGGFLIEAVFEMVETMLAIVSNTLSFMRLGAFALNHVGFSMAFFALADIVGGSGSIVVLIFGNILIIGLEGLIVLIQGLRLQYYELFSKFFEGDGRAFVPFKIKG